MIRSQSAQISVVIPTYNHAQFLEQALNSVRAQTYADWEAIVVNNYSEDNTVEVVKTLPIPAFRWSTSTTMA